LPVIKVKIVGNKTGLNGGRGGPVRQTTCQGTCAWPRNLRWGKDPDRKGEGAGEKKAAKRKIAGSEPTHDGNAQGGQEGPLWAGERKNAKPKSPRELGE